MLSLVKRLPEKSHEDVAGEVLQQIKKSQYMRQEDDGVSAPMGQEIPRNAARGRQERVLRQVKRRQYIWQEDGEEHSGRSRSS